MSVLPRAISACCPPVSFFSSRLTGEKPDHHRARGPQERCQRKGTRPGPPRRWRVAGPAIIQCPQRNGSAHENTCYLQPWDGRCPDDVPTAAGHAEKLSLIHISEPTRQ